MREYIRKSSGVPKSVHMRVKALIMDYERLRSLRADLVFEHASQKQDGPAREKAANLATVEQELHTIEQIIMLTRGEYSGKTYDDFDPLKAYWNYNYFNYQHIRTEQSPNGPSVRTWNRYKDRFIKRLAKKMNIFF